VAPFDRIHVSSDATGLVEQIAVGALRARQVVGEVLRSMRTDGEISVAMAEEIALAVLAGTAERLYS
jgi:hypothetical protein